MEYLCKKWMSKITIYFYREVSKGFGEIKYLTENLKKMKKKQNLEENKENMNNLEKKEMRGRTHYLCTSHLS
jgi:hypothetical protein